MAQSLTVQSVDSDEPVDEQKLIKTGKIFVTWYANQILHRDALKTNFLNIRLRTFKQTRTETRLNFEKLLSETFLLNINSFRDMGRKIRWSKHYQLGPMLSFP